MRSIRLDVLPSAILNRDIVRPSNSQREGLLSKLISRKNALLALLALEIGDLDIILPASGSFAAVERGCVEVAATSLVASALAVAV